MSSRAAVFLVGVGLPLALGVAATACVPTGSAPASDAGPAPTSSSTFTPSQNVMTEPFEDDFERPDAEDAGAWLGSPAQASADATARTNVTRADGPLALFEDATDGTRRVAEGRRNALGPNWRSTRAGAWRIEDGRLCGEKAQNRGVWLERTLPVNARIEFDAVALTDDGDLKAEVWGDGRSYATGTSYTNATSYLTILGGWKNTLHVLARKNEHGNDRKVIRVDKDSDDLRQRAVVAGQLYQFKIERTDGKTIRWSVDGVEYVSWSDSAPLAGQGHDHFGFNVWSSKVCFDNVKVTPL